MKGWICSRLIFSPPRFQRQLLWDWERNKAAPWQSCLHWSLYSEGLRGWRKHQSWGSFQGVWLTWWAAAGWTPAGYLSVLSRYCSFIKNPSALPHLSPSCAVVGLVYLFIFSLEAFLNNASYWSEMSLLIEMCADRKHSRLAIVFNLSLYLFHSVFFNPVPFHLLLSLLLVHSGPDLLMMHWWLFLEGWEGGI